MLSGRHALVMDFGIAKAASAAAASDAVEGGALTTVGLAIGTPTYMAPEQAAGQTSLDGRADLYAVGVVGYEMLSGQPPFTGPAPQAILAGHIGRTPPPLGPLRPDVAPSFAAAIMRCLEKEPEARWQSAEELLAYLEAFATPGGGVTAVADVVPPKRRLPMLAGSAVVALTILGAWLWFGPLHQMRQRRWAREQGIPQLLALADRGQWDSAYALAVRVQALNPADSLFRALQPRFARRVNLRTDPPGATVWRKNYEASDSAWMLLGTTPLDSVLLALSGSGAGGFLNSNRLRLEAPGYRTLQLVGVSFQGTIKLDRDNAIPAEMVRVAGGALEVQFPGFENILKPIVLGDYLMDRFEVTNAEFKAFVDSGGYRRRELWEYPFVKTGRALSWEQAMASMTDRTGRAGPSTWEAGEFPAGQDRYPVAGVSWYEAAAFAKFVGKSLPTVAHWNHAATVRNSAWMVPLSNFSGQGTAAVGTTRGISGYGTYDMAGNVREWCLNASGPERFILGGGWNDLPYQFNDSYTQAPFDRSPANGIRLVKYLTVDRNFSLAAEPLRRAPRDFLKERAAPDVVYAAYRRMYEYDRTPLEAKVLEKVDEGEWTRELVRTHAAYAGDSLLVYLYLPKRGVKPYPAVVYFPSGGAIHGQTLEVRSINFIIKSGRAVLYPVYKGTYQRRDSLKTDTQDSSNFYRDHVVMWAKDLSRGIDYLETRTDVATDHLAFYGLSWGGEMGALMPAVEPRIRVNVLYVAGLDFPRTRPEVDPINFISRITIPTLMINGRYDFFFPLESSQIPMFQLLGTPADQKRHVIAEGSHFVPRPRLIPEVLDWLDRYQPVGR